MLNSNWMYPDITYGNIAIRRIVWSSRSPIDLRKPRDTLFHSGEGRTESIGDANGPCGGCRPILVCGITADPETGLLLKFFGLLIERESQSRVRSPSSTSIRSVSRVSSIGGVLKTGNWRVIKNSPKTKFCASCDVNELGNSYRLYTFLIATISNMTIDKYRVFYFLTLNLIDGITTSTPSDMSVAETSIAR